MRLGDKVTKPREITRSAMLPTWIVENVSVGVGCTLRKDGHASNFVQQN